MKPVWDGVTLPPIQHVKLRYVDGLQKTSLVGFSYHLIKPNDMYDTD